MPQLRTFLDGFKQETTVESIYSTEFCSAQRFLAEVDPWQLAFDLVALPSVGYQDRGTIPAVRALPLAPFCWLVGCRIHRSTPTR